MKTESRWEEQELIAMIPSFEEHALASLPPKPRPQTEASQAQGGAGAPRAAGGN